MAAVSGVVRTFGKEKTVGKLTIFTSYTPGAGKSYYMMQKALEEKASGKNVVIGFWNSEHRDTNRDNICLPQGWCQDAKGKRKYFLSNILDQSPDLVVMDEMGMRGLNLDNRANFVYEDIETILHYGADVYTTANLKKFENMNLYFKKISGIGAKRTIPEKYLQMAHKIYFIDRSPDLMRRDFKEGKLFGERYMKTKIMKKNFTLQTLEPYRQISLKLLENYKNVEIIKRES